MLHCLLFAQVQAKSRQDRLPLEGEWSDGQFEYLLALKDRDGGLLYAISENHREMLRSTYSLLQCWPDKAFFEDLLA